MKTSIAKRFDFDAAHRLPHVPDGHKCKRMHGHTYVVEVVLTGEIEVDGPNQGMLVDYADLAKAWEPVHAILDHRVLNDIEGLDNPTTEVLAPFIWNMLVDALPLLSAVRVFESATTWCEVTG